MKTLFLLILMLISSPIHPQAADAAKMDKGKSRISFVSCVDLNHATKDGFYVNGYVVNITYEQAKQMQGKRVKISGKIERIKGLDQNSLEEAKQGRGNDYLYIANPSIEVVGDLYRAESGIDPAILRTKGHWIDPIDHILKIDTPGPCKSCDLPLESLSISTDSSRLARFAQAGQVSLITYIGDGFAVITKNNELIVAYSGLQSVSVKKGDSVTVGQIIGPIWEETEGKFTLDLALYFKSNVIKRPQDWFTEDFRKKAREVTMTPQSHDNEK